MSIEERIFALVAQACKADIEKVNRETEYVRDLNVTKSVVYFQLAAMFEAEFNVKIDFIKLKNSRTVRATVDYMKSLVPQ